MRNDHGVPERWELCLRVEKGVEFLQLLAKQLR